MTDERSTALARRIDPTELGMPSGPTADVALVADAMSRASAKGYTLLGPTTKISYIPPGHVISIRIVEFGGEFNAEQQQAKSNGNWYRLGNGLFALHRSALDQLAAAASISTVKSVTTLEEPSMWKCTHRIRMKSFDGQVVEVERTKILDLRNGSAEAAAMTAGQLKGARQHGAALCESKAVNRCIRSALGLKGGYTVDEKNRPFVFPVLIWLPDMENPRIAEMVAARELGITEGLYGPSYKAVDAGPIEVPVLTDQSDAAEMAAVQTDEREREPIPARQERRQEQPAEQSVEQCVQCGAPLPYRVASYSTDKYGEPLCYQCQQER